MKEWRCLCQYKLYTIDTIPQMLLPGPIIEESYLSIEKSLVYLSTWLQLWTSIASSITGEICNVRSQLTSWLILRGRLSLSFRNNRKLNQVVHLKPGTFKSWKSRTSYPNIYSMLRGDIRDLTMNNRVPETTIAKVRAIQNVFLIRHRVEFYNFFICLKTTQLFGADANYIYIYL